MNSYVMARQKLWPGGCWPWTRAIGSTVAGQAMDSIIATFGRRANSRKLQPAAMDTKNFAATVLPARENISPAPPSSEAGMMPN